ncbi:uncharacterized protein LOC125856364 [Solanum stenotomum]|uniref:uncharacterized protein LOC125856364 n=1 Tax=Solanum stenotomum TaxID=172797 RepID=UPI0020D1C49A|nr:uncharacterized protein LOC125856364 [Solanum stenotomum]
MDDILIANEAIDSRSSLKKSGILCKLDIEKAYDQVNWDFLMFMLEKMGFGLKWRQWIKFCISSVSFSVSISGCPTGFFSSQRGLRQENHLKILRLFLVLFEGMSGLHVNWRKSFLYPVNEVPNMGNLKLILGGEVGALPTTYLGMPLGAKSKSLEI